MLASLKMRYLCLSLLLLFAVLPVGAEGQTYHVLYSLHADVDGEKGEERLLMVSTTSSDPTSPGPKEFWVMKLRGDKYERVHRAGPDEGEFTNSMVMWQIESPETMLPGISLLPRGGKYPVVRIVFAPSSDYLVDFQYDGKTYRDVTAPGP